MNKRGFTLIELIMVIVILGILAIVAIPRYRSLQKQAREAAIDGVVGSIRGGIHIYFADTRDYPTTLEETDATVVFENVLEQGITVAVGDVGWTVDGNIYTYTFPGGAPDGGIEVYEYLNDATHRGTFTRDATASTHTR